MTRKPFSVRIFLQDGHADGVRIVSRSKWSGRGLVIPRTSLAAEQGRAELQAPGVYLLTGAGGGRPTLCLGAADPVCDGLTRHAADSRPWSSAVVFTCKDDSLDSIQFQSIAATLLHLAQVADKAEIINPGTCERPDLSDLERAAADNFLDHMLELYPLLGVTAFS